jgi:purine-nucleoside phosphorylase
MEIMDQIREAVDFIRGRTAFEPEFGIILGTGLGGLADDMEIEVTITYDMIPHFPISTVESHSGRLIFGMLGDRPVVAMQGRFHYYEGYSAQQVVFPVRVMKYLGIKRLFISNAAGSLQEDLLPGDLMIIRDHINMQPESPFRGRHAPELGPYFVDPSVAYKHSLVNRALEIAKEREIRCRAGVYVSVAGPHLETAAEYDFLHRIGGDAVGMSTVPEILAASQMGLPVFAVSVITDKGYPPETVKEVTVEEVIAVAREAEPRMTVLLKQLIEEA